MTSPARTAPFSTHLHSRSRCEPRLAYEDEETALVFLTVEFGLRELARREAPDGSAMIWMAFGG